MTGIGLISEDKEREETLESSKLITVTGGKRNPSEQANPSEQ